jgi:hypothetical protein
LDSFLISRNLEISEQEVLDLAKATPLGSIPKLKAAANELFDALHSRPPDLQGDGLPP